MASCVEPEEYRGLSPEEVAILRLRRPELEQRLREIDRRIAAGWKPDTVKVEVLIAKLRSYLDEGNQEGAV